MVSRLGINIIDTHDFKTMGIVDTSWYNPDIKIEDATIEIQAPGFKYAVSPFFMVKGMNVYNSNGVGLTKASCEEELIDLPDGLWKIRYSICPNDKLFIEKIFLRTDKIECKYNQAFLNLDLSSCDTDLDKSKMKQLDNIDLYINGAIAAANNKDYKLSSDLYKKANASLDAYLENNGQCGC